MLPLKQLEAAATSGPSVILPSSMSSQSTLGKKSEISDKSAGNLPQWTPRADREDMELDTKLFTEPLPTNQQVNLNQVTISFLSILFSSFSYLVRCFIWTK